MTTPYLLPEMEPSTKTVEKFGLSFQCREFNQDEEIIRRYIGPYLKRIMTFRAAETWLDIGAHIGGFTCVAAKHGCSVLAFEPNPAAFALLQLNVQSNQLSSSVQMISAAVVGHAVTGPVKLYQTQNTKNGMDSLIAKRGRIPIEVPAVRFNDLMAAQPKASVKMDIEGGELDILQHLESSSIWPQRFVLEFHSQHLNDKDHRLLRGTIQQFKEHYKFVRHDRDDTGSWITYLYGEN